MNANMMILDELSNAQSRFAAYPNSFDESEGTRCGLVRRRDTLEKLLVVSGPKAAQFEGTVEGGARLCPLTNANAKALQALFPYTKPQQHAGHAFTFGLGDRLGLATPGHVRAIREYDAFPVLAQQSIRELTLTNRTFEDVIAAATFGVFQEGYRKGYGADGDHLKTIEEIDYALKSGCTMITLDCSNHIHTDAAFLTEADVDARYAALPADVRAHYEEMYLGRELPLVGALTAPALRRIVLVFADAINHAETCFKHIDAVKTVPVDLELSIDETRTITSPAEHFVIASEVTARGIKLTSVAPHFSGEFEKGIEYIGNVRDFNRDFVVHQEIADHFGYKLSVHSGSDKFSVFSIVGRVTHGHVHVKTAGTSWLEAVRIMAIKDPALYRRSHIYAVEHRPEAEKYYHVTTKVDEIPDIALESDAYLPEYLQLPASRQTMHIAYGLLLNQAWFREAFFPLMAREEEAYADALVSHIGRHLRYLTAEF